MAQETTFAELRKGERSSNYLPHNLSFDKKVVYWTSRRKYLIDNLSTRPLDETEFLDLISSQDYVYQAIKRGHRIGKAPGAKKGNKKSDYQATRVFHMRGQLIGVSRKQDLTPDQELQLNQMTEFTNLVKHYHRMLEN